MIPSRDFYYCPTCGQEICHTKCIKQITEKEVLADAVPHPYTGYYFFRKRIEGHIEFLCPNDKTVLNSICINSRGTI